MPSLFPYSRALVATMTDIAVMLVVMGVAARTGAFRLLHLSGVGVPLTGPLLWGAIIFVQATLAAFAIASIATGFTSADIIWKGVAPFLRSFCIVASS